MWIDAQFMLHNRKLYLLFHKNGDVKEHVVQFLHKTLTITTVQDLFATSLNHEVVECVYGNGTDPDVGLQLHDLLVTSLDLVESLPLLSRVNEVLWKQFYSMPLQFSPSPLYSPLCDSL